MSDYPSSGHVHRSGNISPRSSPPDYPWIRQNVHRTGYYSPLSSSSIDQFQSSPSLPSTRDSDPDLWTRRRQLRQIAQAVVPAAVVPSAVVPAVVFQAAASIAVPSPNKKALAPGSAALSRPRSKNYMPEQKAIIDKFFYAGLTNCRAETRERRMEVARLTGLSEIQVKQAIQDRRKKHTPAELREIEDGSEMVKKIRALDEDLLGADITNLNDSIKDALRQLAATLGQLELINS